MQAFSLSHSAVLQQNARRTAAALLPKITTLPKTMVIPSLQEISQMVPKESEVVEGKASGSEAGLANGVAPTAA